MLDQLQTQEATPDSIMRVMNARKCYMGTIDRFWKIEFAFWQSWCNGGAEKSVQDAILAALPTVDRAVTLIDACRKLSDLEASKLVICCRGSHEDHREDGPRVHLHHAGGPPT